MRGISIPFVVLVTSSMAELSGLAPLLLMATCACVMHAVNIRIRKEQFLVLIVPDWLD